MSYYVKAHSKMGELEEDINARDLSQLAEFVRESFAYMNGCRDTSEVDCSWIEFEYDHVEDEDGDDVTDEAIDNM